MAKVDAHAFKYRVTTRRIEAITKIFQRGKTQVPSSVRRSLGLKDGDKILWVFEDGRWLVERPDS
jgi:bifunctional DNA-binding transcriptional regulator/antitoxin component of YhaV-PrlF toxin-antitoxin module